MKKSVVLTSVVMMLIASTAWAGVSLRYYNKDSSNRTFKVKICGSSKTVTFGSSRTASTTIQGCSNATIYSSCGAVNVKDGDRVEISNGCVKVK